MSAARASEEKEIKAIIVAKANRVVEVLVINPR